MLSFLWITVTFLLALTILITFHEFGHFIVARLCGVKVLRFSVGFGKPLFRFKSKAGTEYVIAAIPLGGYVKMLDETEGPVPEEELSLAFNRKSVYKRIAIIVAGPAFNIIFAVLAYLFVFMYGITSLVPMIGEISPHSVASHANIPKETQITAINNQPVHNWQEVNLSLVRYLGLAKTIQLTLKNPISEKENNYTLHLDSTEYNTNGPSPIQSIGIIPFQPPVPPVIDKVFPYGPADEANLHPGDKILSINNQKITDWNVMRKIVNDNGEQPIDVEFLRADKIMHVMVTPEVQRADGISVAFLGIMSAWSDYPKNLVYVQRYPFLPALGEALHKTWGMTALSYSMIGKMIIGEVPLKSLTGPIGIAQGTAASATVGFIYYLEFLALISISLGVINTLPIPILDGGHLLYCIIELIRGKPVKLRTKETGVWIGLVLILILAFIAFFNDFIRILS